MSSSAEYIATSESRQPHRTIRLLRWHAYATSCTRTAPRLSPRPAAWSIMALLSLLMPCVQGSERGSVNVLVYDSAGEGDHSILYHSLHYHNVSFRVGSLASRQGQPYRGYQDRTPWLHQELSNTDTSQGSCMWTHATPSACATVTSSGRSTPHLRRGVTRWSSLPSHFFGPTRGVRTPRTAERAFYQRMAPSRLPLLRAPRPR